MLYGRRVILAFTDRGLCVIQGDLLPCGLLVVVIATFAICSLAECGVLTLILLLGLPQSSGLAGELRVFAIVPC